MKKIKTWGSMAILIELLSIVAMGATSSKWCVIPMLAGAAILVVCNHRLARAHRRALSK